MEQESGGGWGMYWGGPGRLAGVLGNFQPAASALESRENKSVHMLFQSSLGFLQTSSKPLWFSNKLRGLIFPVSDPRARVPNMGLKLLTPY